MKKTLWDLLNPTCLLLALLLNFQLKAQQTLTQINGWNSYVHLPSNYNSTTSSYPTIIFFPGLGEIGTNASAVISSGPGAYLSQGWDGNVIINSSTVEFIVISLQPPSAYPNEISINQRIQTIKSLYRVNPDKLYLTGLSHGGWCSSTFVSGDPYGGPYTYASQIAAVVTIEGVIPNDNTPYPNLFDNYANVGGRYLGFEQLNDGRDTRNVVDRMNATRAGSAIFVPTNFGNGGHCCWSQFYGGQGVQPGIFMLDGVNQNIYQWLARQSFSNSNQLPIANAGTDKVITLPVSSGTLNGSGTDSDGVIASYLWSKISGPAAGALSNATSAQAGIAGLTQGTYQYQLKVTDNNGAAGTDLIQVTVNAAAATTFTANAGPDQAITLPTSTISLNGSGTEANPGKTIVSYQWTKMSGPATGAITNLNSAVTTVTGLVAGNYGFQLKVTDNTGLTAIDNNRITVNAVTQAPGCNTNAPVTYTIAQTAPGEIYRPNGSLWKGGDTLKITGTSYTVIEFNNIGGDACRPLVIMPMTTLTTPIFRLKGDCRYIKLWGGKAKYGIKINGTLAISSCHHIEADNIECTGGDIGVYCKQDPVYGDPMTYYPNYRMTKFTFKNLWIHDITGEGMYMGITLPSGWPVRSTYSGLDTLIVPVRLDSVEVSNCIVERTSWDAIQLSNARNGNKIFNNTVRNYGTLNMSSQQAGIILGGNCSGDIYNNTIVKGTGNGIEVFGYGVIKVYGNILDSCGYDGKTNSNGTQGQQSIYASDYLNGVEVNPKQTINAYDNAVNHPKTSGAIFITGYNSNSYPSSVYNNKFCIPNAPANWQNIYLKLNVAGSTNTNNILSCSGTSNIPPVANAGSDKTIVLPTNTVSLTGSGTDTDGTISSYGWVKISGPSSGTIATASAANTAINGLQQGSYKFELTVTDNSGALGKDTVQVTVNVAGNISPVANAGSDKSISLPTNTVTLTGSGTDADGVISSYAWAKVSGTSGAILSANAASTVINNLLSGVYRFELTVTDNNGAKGKDTVQVTVNSGFKIIRVNIFGGSNPYNDTKWNNWNFNASVASNNFLYEDRTNSTVGAVLTGDVLVADNGANYASGTIVTAPEVLRYNSAATSMRTLSLKGLDPTKKYSMELYASRANTGNSTVFEIGNIRDTVNTSNINDYATFSNIIPDNGGNVVVSISRIGVWNYIAGFSIIEQAGSSAGRNTGVIEINNTQINVNSAGVVYPNPFSSSFKVQIRDSQAGNYTLILSDFSGRKLLQKKVHKLAGEQIETIRVNNLSSGTYLLQIIPDKGSITTQKLIKN